MTVLQSHLQLSTEDLILLISEIHTISHNTNKLKAMTLPCSSTNQQEVRVTTYLINSSQ